MEALSLCSCSYCEEGGLQCGMRRRQGRSVRRALAGESKGLGWSGGGMEGVGGVSSRCDWAKSWVRMHSIAHCRFVRWLGLVTGRCIRPVQIRSSIFGPVR